MKRTRTAIYLGLFVAMNVVLVRIFSFMPLPTIRIDFGFAPIALSSSMLGPVLGGVTGVISDLVGYFISPMGPYSPGFTISGFISGVIYGMVLYKKPNTILRAVIASVLYVVLVELVLNTIWLQIMFNKGILAMLPGRILKSAMMLPLQVFVIYVLRRYLKMFIDSFILSRRAA